LEKYSGFIVKKYLNNEFVEELKPIIPIIKYESDKFKSIK
jgi:hypothetical protein